ncbi:MAG: 5-oxoprolinase subunit PxpB [Ferruginibacter sp.]
MTSLGDAALLLSYGNIIDRTINEKIIGLHQALIQKPFPGFIESVPAYASLAVFYNALFIKQSYPDTLSIFDFVKEQVLQVSAVALSAAENNNVNNITIPVYYNGEDLEYVAALHQISTDELIQFHTGEKYHVYMTGFLPGFAYMGTVHKKIITPRKEQPRIKVNAGSVGIAGEQTGIYPFDSPGGWQIIGTTPLRIFDTGKDDPCLLKAGDTVTFTSINQQEFEQLNEH